MKRIIMLLLTLGLCLGASGCTRSYRLVWQGTQAAASGRAWEMREVYYCFLLSNDAQVAMQDQFGSEPPIDALVEWSVDPLEIGHMYGQKEGLPPGERYLYPDKAGQALIKAVYGEQVATSRVIVFPETMVQNGNNLDIDGDGIADVQVSRKVAVFPYGAVHLVGVRTLVDEFAAVSNDTPGPVEGAGPYTMTETDMKSYVLVVRTSNGGKYLVKASGSPYFCKIGWRDMSVAL